MTYSDCDYIPFVGGSKLMRDYINQSEDVKDFIRDFPSKELMVEIARNHSFTSRQRKVLFDAISAQYKIANIASPSILNSVLDNNCFTITTGHQLNIFGGPKYFIYKIVSAFKLANEMNAYQSEFNYLPVFWMASEDHDFDEINRVKLYGETLQAKQTFNGPVGRLESAKFKEVFDELKKILGTSENALDLITMFDEAFSQLSWANFTRYWVNQLFDGKVIILDGDDAQLKKEFSSIVKRELEEGITDVEVSIANQKLASKGYHTQVAHREINLFYIDNNVRERIVRSEDGFRVINQKVRFELGEVDQIVTSISPNALLRPVYQETILPNVAYLGGAGELAYWLQLKGVFEKFETSFPALIVRDSFLFVKESDEKQLRDLGLELSDLSQDDDQIIREYINRNDLVKVDFKEELANLNLAMDDILSKVKGLNRDYQSMVEAKRQQMKNFVDKLELRAYRDAKFREEVNLKKITQLKKSYFPGGGLIERSTSFMEEYIEMGKLDYFDNLMKYSDPLDARIKVIYCSN